MTPIQVITALLLADVRVSVAFEDDGERLELEPAHAVTPDLLYPVH